MQLKFTHDIDNNIFSTVITIDSFGTEQFSEDEERELLNDFPSKIAYRNMVFSKNVRMNGTVPEVTTEEPATAEGEEATAATVVEVTIPPISNKEIVINEGFTATYKIDVNKVSASAVDASVLTSKELVAQAYCVVFDEVIREAVEEVMQALRVKAPSFAGETLVSV